MIHLSEKLESQYMEYAAGLSCVYIYISFNSNIDKNPGKTRVSDLKKKMETEENDSRNGPWYDGQTRKTVQIQKLRNSSVFKNNKRRHSIKYRIRLSFPYNCFME
mmetsp:Transcript_2342/g.3401  ORF Transcript_2342/g.3401 Transcript_2342/m.3401 type:complete len:105 (+) Transcript_2342:451-765(+)